MHPSGISLVHYVTGIGPWDWDSAGFISFLAIAAALETWADGQRLPRDPRLRSFFGDGFYIKQYAIDLDALRQGSRPWFDRYAEAAAIDHGDGHLLHYDIDPSGMVPDRLRYGRVPLLAYVDGKYSEKSLDEEMLSGKLESTWLDGAFAYVASLIIDSTGTAYIPDCLLRTGDRLSPGTWLAPKNWRTARTPSPFWLPILNDRYECEEDERGHFCFPQTLPQIEHHWSMSPFISSLRSGAENRYSVEESILPQWIVRHGVNRSVSWLSESAYEELRDCAGEEAGDSTPEYCKGVWVDPFQDNTGAVPVTEYFGLSAFAAAELQQDVLLGVQPARCPDCGLVSVLGPRQHRDRLCNRCAKERARLRFRRAKARSRTSSPTVSRTQP